MAAKDKFLSEKWLNAHLKKIENRAGSRYTPEYNVDLPISEIFDAISRTRDFYKKVRDQYRNLNRAFADIKKYRNNGTQKLYSNLESEISQLLEALGKIKEYDVKKICWGKISEQANIAIEISSNLLHGLREEKEKNQNRISSISDSLIHYLIRTEIELKNLNQLSASSKARLSNSPFLALTGAAGIGKTHLLCDIVSNRVENKKAPAVLVFGELFATTRAPFTQIIQQLGLKMDKDQFLFQLNESGKKSRGRAILIIDALNETRKRNFWRKNLRKIVYEIKKYPHLALVISFRKMFEEEVIPKGLSDVFIREEHQGFEPKEEEAVEIFFRWFELPLPEVPLLSPVFQSPIFLLLFCKAFQRRMKRNRGRKQKQIFKGHEGATYIFESFVDEMSKKIAKNLNISNKSGETIWDTIIEKVAEEMVSKKTDRIAESQLIAIIKSAYPAVEQNKFINELESNLLLVRVQRYSAEKEDYSGFDFRFPFQKFSDHLIGRYIFKRFEQEFGKTNKNIQTAKRFFSKRRKLGKFLSSGRNREIIEALSIQCPEHLDGCEFVEVAPYLEDFWWVKESFIESLILREPKAFSPGQENTRRYINDKIIQEESSLNSLLNAFLSVALVPKHPFNADFLHKWLLGFSMPERDSVWSTFLHYQYGEKKMVDRLIEWGWSNSYKSHIDNQSIYLYAVTLVWFLTTPNRSLRDKATKALVSFLTDRLDTVVDLLKQFKDVNDFYVAERLYAVAYGCAIRSRSDRVKLKTLSKWVYDEVFGREEPPVHILLRDYARGIIEIALHEKIEVLIDREKIEPPFSSEWPEPETIPSAELLRDKYCPEIYSQERAGNIGSSLIWSSVMYNFGALGDFGNYILNNSIDYWSTRKLDNGDHYEDINALLENLDTKLAQRWVFDRVMKLGWDFRLHNTFDERMRYDRSGRTERIGKKYQWIAFYELLALISDNFVFKEERSLNTVGKFEGPWQLFIRNIDPSCVLREFPNKKPENMPFFSTSNIQRQYNNVVNKEACDIEWLKETRNLPDPKKSIELIDEAGHYWVSFKKHIKWEGETHPEQEKYASPTRYMWYMIQGYLIRKKDKNKAFEWAKKQDFSGRWMPESRDFWQESYLGEYPWARAFFFRDTPSHPRVGWTNQAESKTIPAEVLLADDLYESNIPPLDCSTSEGFNILLPAKHIVDEMRLIQTHIDGRFFDREKNLVAFDPNVFDADTPHQVLIRKDKLIDFLQRKEYSLIWVLVGEKNMIGGGVSGQPLGWLSISGTYMLDKKNEIVGEMKKYFLKD